MLAGAFGVAAVALFAGYVQWRASTREARAEAEFPPEGRIFEIEGHEVHGLVLGDGDTDLVLIHGSSGNTRDYTQALARDLSRSYRVFVFDRPGLGYSDPVRDSGATLTDQARILAHAARHLGAHRPVVVGQSYGGAVALAWAVHHRDDLSGLVLLAAPSQPWSTGLGWYYALLNLPVLSHLVIPLLTAFVSEARVERELADIFAPQTPPPGYGAHIGAGLTLRRASLRANARQRGNLLAEVTALQPHYGQIAVPVESLHGTADTTVGLRVHAEPLSAQIPGAVLTPLPGIGHMPHHVARPQVTAAIARVVARAAEISASTP